MVKTLFLGVLIIYSFACVAPAPFSEHPISHQTVVALNPLEDPAARSERSTNTNFSFFLGTTRKIQMFVKNRHLQILPDGTVNGTTDDTSGFTILQRSPIGIGQMKIQGTATCQYLCMDICGLLYGSKVFGDECVFNEKIDQHYYNTYSSTKYSNDKRTLYLALNRRGQPRKVMLKAAQPLGRLSSYTRVLTRIVLPERMEELHRMRHQAHMCLPSSTQNTRLQHTPSADPPVEHQRCRKRKKRKKKKRKCSEGDPELCTKRQNHNKKVKQTERESTVKNKQKSNSDSSKKIATDGVKKRKPKKGRKKNVNVIVSTEATTQAEEGSTHEEDYGTESTTQFDFDDITASPLADLSESSNVQPL